MLMMKKTNEDLSRLLAAFRRETLENFFTLSSFLKSENISPRQLKSYLEWKTEQINVVKVKKQKENDKRIKEAKEQFIKWQRKVKKCPLCDTPLMLNKISILKGNANREGWRSLWSCPNEDCLFEEYSKEFADKIYTEIMED